MAALMHIAWHDGELVAVGEDADDLTPAVTWYMRIHPEVLPQHITVQTVRMTAHPRWFDAAWWAALTEREAA